MRQKIIFVCWILFAGLLTRLLFLPSFDLDESLYRLIAEHMKSSGNYWSMVWGQTNVFHKPPPFYWLICLFSFLVDGTGPNISALASRIPSALATFGIAVLLAKEFLVGMNSTSVTNVAGARTISWKKFFTEAPPYFALALFPALTGAAIIFDPLQSFFLTITLILFRKAMAADLSTLDWFTLSASTFFASTIKGLNGILIPFFSLALFFVFQVAFGKLDLKTASQKAWPFAYKYVLPTLAASSAFFAFLDQKIGRAFTHEFFIVQHFSRATQAMEGHTAGLWFHPFVLFAGGGVLTALILRALLLNKAALKPAAWVSISWVVGTVGLFMISKTTLPHYTWPAWPALILLFTDLPVPSLQDALSKRSKKMRIVETLAALPISLIAVFCIFAASGKITQMNFGFQTNDRVQTILASLPPLGHSAELYSCAVFGFLVLLLWRVVRTEFLLVFNLLWLIALANTLPPIGYAMTQQPLIDLGKIAADHSKAGDCIRYIGPLSATLDLALNRPDLLNSCEIKDATFILAPIWKKNECQENSMALIHSNSYFVLCSKSRN